MDVEATKKLGGWGAQVVAYHAAITMSFEFKRDGRLIEGIGLGQQEYKWKAIKVDEARKELTIETDVPGPGKVTVTMTKESTVMRWEEEDADLSLALRRKRREP